VASLALEGPAGRAGVRVLGGISALWVALGLLSDGLVTLVLPVQLERVGERGATTLGLVAFIGLVAGTAAQPVAGAISDSLRPVYGRRAVLVAGGLAAAVGLGLLAAASNMTTILLAFVAVQVAVAAAQAAQQGYLPDLVPPAQRGTAAGLKGLADVGGAALGFVVLGALLNGGGPRPALIAAAAALLLGLVITVVLVREPRRRLAVSRHPLRRVLAVDPARDSSFLAAVAARFLFLLGTFAVGRFFLFFIEDRIVVGSGNAALEAGALLGVLALVTALAAPPAGWAADRVGRHAVMLVGAAASATGVGLLVTARAPGAVLGFGGLMAVGSAAFSAANWARTADTAPPAEAGRYLALANVGTAGAAAAAGLLGPLVDRGGAGPGGGYGTLFATCALLFTASGAVMVVDRRHEVARRQVAAPDCGMAAAPTGTAGNNQREVDHA
jgi:MFS family permease